MLNEMEVDSLLCDMAAQGRSPWFGDDRDDRDDSCGGDSSPPPLMGIRVLVLTGLALSIQDPSTPNNKLLKTKLLRRNKGLA